MYSSSNTSFLPHILLHACCHCGSSLYFWYCTLHRHLRTWEKEKRTEKKKSCLCLLLFFFISLCSSSCCSCCSSFLPPLPCLLWFLLPLIGFLCLSLHFLVLFLSLKPSNNIFSWPFLFFFLLFYVLFFFSHLRCNSPLPTPPPPPPPPLLSALPPPGGGGTRGLSKGPYLRRACGGLAVSGGVRYLFLEGERRRAADGVCPKNYEGREGRHSGSREMERDFLGSVVLWFVFVVWMFDIWYCSLVCLFWSVFFFIVVLCAQWYSCNLRVF